MKYFSILAAAGVLLTSTNAAAVGEGDFDSVFFNTSESVILPSSRAQLNNYLSTLAIDEKEIGVIISGFTDSSGTYDYNESLGEARAKAVREYVKNSGFKGTVVAVLSEGESQAGSCGDSVSVCSLDRRVSVISMPLVVMRNLYPEEFAAALAEARAEGGSFNLPAVGSAEEARQLAQYADQGYASAENIGDLADIAPAAGNNNFFVPASAANIFNVATVEDIFPVENAAQVSPN